MGRDGFRNFYTRNLFKIRLACRALHKLRTYKKPQIEAIEIINEDLSERELETVNIISACPKPVYS